MKNYSLLLLLIVVWIVGCTETEKKATLTINGQVSNPKENTVNFRFGDTTFTADIDSTGAFFLKVEFDSAQYGLFMHGQERSEIYLSPDSEIKLSIDAELFDETLKLEGPQSAPSSYLLEKYLLVENLPNAYQRIQSDSAMNFIAFMDSVTAIKNELLQTYQSNLPTEFFAFEQSKNKYEGINFITILVVQYSYQNKDLPSEEGFFDFKDDLDFNDPALLKVPQYTSAISNLLSAELYGTLDWNNEASRLDFFTRYIENAEKAIQSEEVLSKILLDHIDTYKSYVDIEVVEKQFEDHKLIFPPTDYTELKDVLAKIKALAPGAEVPDFEFETLEGDPAKLSDFRGTLVYIDLWATWCGPCIAEQPAAEKLLEEFEGAPITLLAVSTDSSPDPWRKMVKERALSGTHVYVENAWQADIMKHFVVEGIPRYILLDQEGKIIDQNAPRPSGNIAEVLKKHLDMM